MSDYIFQAEQIEVGYGETAVVKQVSFAVKRGEILTLIGENGAGKSTILKNIMGQLKPLGGTMFLEKEEFASFSASELAKKMAVVLTNRVKGEYMTCEDVVSMGRYPHTGMFGILSCEDKRKVAEALKKVGIAHLSEKSFDTLSDGQKQLTMLARALCQEPEILVLDEPTSFLDMRYKLELLDILQRMAREEKLTVIMSLHELELAERVSGQILCIKDHYVNRYGTPEEIFTDNYIEELFGIKKGSYDAVGCRPELKRADGTPRVFVIGGGGSATPVYRKLQRQGIPFATGILSKNDLDYPVAVALAAEVIAVEAFEPIDEAIQKKAALVMEKCEKVICTIEHFGSYNRANEELLQQYNKP